MIGWLDFAPAVKARNGRGGGKFSRQLGGAVFQMGEKEAMWFLGQSKKSALAKKPRLGVGYRRDPAVVFCTRQKAGVG